MVQRLVQKEKQVIQLQAELDRYQAQNPVETQELVRSLCFKRSIILRSVQEDKAKRERDRAKWNGLMDEISNLKAQVRVTALT